MTRLAGHFDLNSVPRYIGGCGRMGLIEGGLTPLTDYLDATWDRRADLASQILSVVEGLLTGSWILVSWNLDWDSFAVTRSGQVILVNLNSFTPIERSLVSKPGVGP